MDSVFGAHRLTNKKHIFPTNALVQCMQSARQDCLRVKALKCRLGANKLILRLLLSRDKHEAFLPHESACSVYERRTAIMLARKSTNSLHFGLRSKSRFCKWRSSLCKLVTLLSHKSACSAHGPCTARILVFYKTFMLAEAKK